MKYIIDRLAVYTKEYFVTMFFLLKAILKPIFINITEILLIDSNELSKREFIVVEFHGKNFDLTDLESYNLQKKTHKVKIYKESEVKYYPRSKVSVVDNKYIFSSEMSKSHFSPFYLPQNVDFYINKQFFKSKTKRVNSNVVIVPNLASKNYYHFITDVVSRLLLIIESGEQIDYIVSSESNLTLLTQILKYLECKVPIFEFKPKTDYVYKNAYLFINDFGIFPWKVDLFSKYFCTLNTLSYNLIYISRSDAKVRRIINEGELIDYLSTKGFKAFQMSKLSFHEQVDLFNNAKIVIASHGAGLTNLLFGGSIEDVIEIFPFNKSRPDMYKEISLRKEISYHQFLGIHGGDHFTDDVFVDLTLLDEMLTPIIDKGAYNE